MNKIEIRAEKHPWSFGVDILITDGNSVAKEIIFEEQDVGTIIQPTLNIEPNQAQRLMDDLWAAGFRPSEGTGSAGSLKATEKHLEDMRKIAFNHLKMTEAIK